ncbi:hypothetical protein B7463_g8006, partial [Scytalidium lignicola]
MKLPILTFILSSSVLVSATSKSCTDYTISVSVTSSNYAFSTAFEDDFQLIDFLTDATSRDNSSFHPFTGQVKQTGSYSISGTFCAPTGGAKKNTVLLLSHGLGFDRSYWHPAISPEKYSFVDFAIGKGYAVFYYDRLGVGESITVSGYVNQGTIQVAILQSLIKSIRSGKYTGSGKAPGKVVLVGHSFGRSISAGALTLEPDLADGYSYSGVNVAGFIQATGLRIAAVQHASKWGHLDNVNFNFLISSNLSYTNVIQGYVTGVDLYANINVFFKANDYDPAFAAYIDSTRSPLAINELVSLGLLPQTPVDFRGPAMVITGQYDFVFCQSQCDDILKPGAAPIFKKARAFDAVSYPGSGHALNLASNAQGAFEIITNFLQHNGL